MKRIIDSIRHIIIAIERRINELPSWLIIFLPFACLYLTTIPNGNEEQYMQLAKQYVNPNWIVNSQNLTEVAGTRIIYQFFVGHLLQYFSFEIVVLVLRLLLILLYTLVLNKLYKKISIVNSQILIHLTLFIYVFHQSFFAGSWMILGVEPKCFAYPLVLLSFYYILNNKVLNSLVSLIFATYLHVLVGGYSFFYILLTLLIFRKDARITFRQLGAGLIIYTSLLIPLLAYLVSNSLNYEISDNEISPSWIYTYFRSPHHTAIAANWEYFIRRHFKGVLMALISLIISIRMYYSISPISRNIKIINQFVIVSLLGTLLLVSIAFIDTDGVLLKFYLYRINSLSTFFFSVLLSIWLFRFMRYKYLKLAKALLPIICLFALIFSSFKNHSKNYNAQKVNESLIEVGNFIRLNTHPESLVFSYQESFSLTRKSQRSLFIVKSFIPAQINKVNQWYTRVLEKEKVRSSPEYLIGLVNDYKINYIISPSNQENINDFKLIFKNNDFSLYETNVKSSW